MARIFAMMVVYEYTSTAERTATHKHGMHLDASSSTPMFKQIANGLRESIAAGVYQVGESVPSVRAQAQRLRINPNTVQRAYEELQREGVLESRAGLGLYVAPGALRAAQAASRTSVRDALLVTINAALRAGMTVAELDCAFDEAKGAVTTTQSAGAISAPTALDHARTGAADEHAKLRD